MRGLAKEPLACGVVRHSWGSLLASGVPDSSVGGLRHGRLANLPGRQQQVLGYLDLSGGDGGMLPVVVSSVPLGHKALSKRFIILSLVLSC